MKQMYKVFLNDRVIKIGSPENITINQPAVTFSDACSADDIRNWFRTFETSRDAEVLIVHNNPEAFFKLFQSAFTVIHAAGGAVVSGNRLLFIFRNGKWDLPKGKMTKKETAEEAAIREVEEETGITPEGFGSRLPSTFHIYRSTWSDAADEWIFKETYWFQLNCSRRVPGIPQQEEGITRVEWVPVNALDEVLSNTYENLKQIISLYRR